MYRNEEKENVSEIFFIEKYEKNSSNREKKNNGIVDKCVEKFVDFLFELKNYWNKFPVQKKFAFVSCFILLLFLFYWYEYRPSRIRIECDKYTSLYFENNELVRRSENWNRVYKSCLESRGLER